MLYTEYEIRQSHRLAAFPDAQVHTLAELNDCDPAIIARIVSLDRVPKRGKWRREDITCNYEDTGEPEMAQIITAPSDLRVGNKTKQYKPTFGMSLGDAEGGSKRIWEGRIVYIHPDRKFFTLEFATRQGAIRESYHFVG